MRGACRASQYRKRHTPCNVDGGKKQSLKQSRRGCFRFGQLGLWLAGLWWASACHGFLLAISPEQCLHVAPPGSHAVAVCLRSMPPRVISSIVPGYYLWYLPTYIYLHIPIYTCHLWHWLLCTYSEPMCGKQRATHVLYLFDFLPSGCTAVMPCSGHVLSQFISRNKSLNAMLVGARVP